MNVELSEEAFKKHWALVMQIQELNREIGEVELRIRVQQAKQQELEQARKTLMEEYWTEQRGLLWDGVRGKR